MEKLPKIIYETLPPIKLYLDELNEIIDLLKEHYGDKIEIRTKDYKFNDVDVLQQLDAAKIHHLEISAGEKWYSGEIEMELKRNDVKIICKQDTPTNRGIVAKLKDLLLKRKRLVNTYRRFWPLGILIPAGVVTLVTTRYSVNLPRLVSAGLGALGMLLFNLWIILADYRYHTVIIPKLKRDAPSFWTRNKDQIWLVVIGAIVGTIITSIVALLIKD
jgi:hypothetical protein